MLAGTVLLVACVIVGARDGEGGEDGAAGPNLDEFELHRRLFTDYNVDVLPVRNRSEQMTVHIKFSLIAIDNIDEKKQTLSTRAFLEVTWRDELLCWEARHYPGVHTINVRSEQIWLPDLSLSGTLDSLLDIGQREGRALITADGNVTMWPYKLYTIACKIAVAKFPIDEQKCTFDFQSWTNPNTVVRLRNPSGEIDMNYATESGEWEAISLATVHDTTEYEGQHWDHVKFNLLLRRKWLFYAMNSMAPIVCISLLNVLCFLLPAQSGERVTLCISIFLTLAVFLTVINNSMPESSEEVAVFGVYVGLQLVGSALTIFSTVLSIYFFHKEASAPVPLPFRLLAVLCCIRSNQSPEHKPVGRPDPGHTRNSITSTEEKPIFKRRVTWVSVSLAVDRLCFVGSVFWHVLLLTSLVLELNV